jgi:type VI secretion system secreted protein VgrG
MLNNIFKALESLGLTAQKRAIHIQFSNQNLNSQVFLQRIDGQHELNAGFKAELICLSTNATIPLKQFIGSQAAIDTVTDQGQLSRVTGIITQALQGQSDGSLTLYKLTLEDPTALWKQRRNSRVFMNKSVRDVVEIVFKEWQQKSPLFASSLTLDLSGLSQDYDVRPFIMQSNESDYDFLTRLMRSEGINWLVDESKLKVAIASEQIQAQKLRLIDDNSQYQALDRRHIRYHRSSATEQYDSMTSLVGQRSLQPSAVHVQRWQADALEQEEGAGSVQSTHKHSEQHDNASLGLEQAWHFSPAWMQDLNGEDGATQSGNAQIEKLNQNLGQYYDLQSKQFIAKSTVRDTHVGYWFELAEHPEIDQHSGADKEFLITGKQFYNQNNLPKDLQQQINQLLAQSHWQLTQQSNTEERQANQLTLQRRNIKTVPEYNPLQHRPTASPQRAKVVGPSGEEIHVDEWGRIKVRFLFTRNEDHSHDGGAGANDNDTDSAWVDVLTPWAGEGYGARFLPRINEIVVIDFFDGNIDRPFVVGRIHEAQRSPTKFDNAGKLPDTKKLAGIKSKEYQGEGYNQLRFDDTTGQISAQLQSSHAASQLNLGKLSHPKATAESEDRGEGFELRTDQWGAVRAGEGLLVSTHKQDQAKGEHLDAQPAKQQLEGNQSNAKALSEVAKNQQTDEIESLDQLKEFAEQIQEKIAQFKKSLLLLNSPAGIGLSTNEDIHLSADGQINQFAGDSINLSTQKNLITHAQNRISLFAAQNGIKQVAAKGKFEVQAQSDGIDLLAKQGIQIISTEDRIEISSPKEIVITAGGSQIKLNGSGIFPTTGGKFEVKAGQHLFMGGAKVQSVLPTLSNLPMNKENYKYTNRIDLFDIFNGTEFSKINYRAHLKGQNIYKVGNLDEYGRTERFTSIEAKQEEVVVVVDEFNGKWRVFDEEEIEGFKNLQEKIDEI